MIKNNKYNDNNINKANNVIKNMLGDDYTSYSSND